MKYIHRLLNLLAGIVTGIMVVPPLYFVFGVFYFVAIFSIPSVYYIKYGKKMTAHESLSFDYRLNNIIGIILEMPGWVIKNIGPTYCNA